MPKRKIENEDEKDTKKARTGPMEYDFFHEKPEYVYKLKRPAPVLT